MKGFKYVITFVFLIASLSVFSQDNKMVKNRRKVLAKQEEAKKKAGEEALEEGRKRHLNIQTKKTKKRMKKQAKKSKALNRQRGGKKKSFFARIFGGE